MNKMKVVDFEFESTFYRCRIVEDNTGDELIIGSTSFLEALHPGSFEDENEGFASTEASNIYDDIFFFTNDGDLQLNDAALIDVLKQSNPDYF